MAAEEEHLVVRLAGGDRGEPLSILYDRYAGRLYGLGMRLLGDRAMAEEMVADTFVRLWREAPQFDSARESARSFLFAIARRTATDLRRGTSSRTRFTGVGQGPAHVSEGVLDWLMMGLEVREALDSLARPHREALELYHETDLSQGQIAERLGLSPVELKGRTHEALRALRLELEEREVRA